MSRRQEDAAWEAARTLTHIAGMAHVGKDWKAMAYDAAQAIYREFGEPPAEMTSAGGNYFDNAGSKP